jgi:uncharacterized membrane protein YheB (UPF0754 family)
VSVPVVAAVVGWGTNWVAIELTFRPLRFIGIPPYLGWQGIIPSKARKMAATFVDSTMHRLGTFGELFETMEPRVIAEHITGVLVPRLERYTDEVVFWGGYGRAWRSVPALIKAGVYERVRAEMPRLVAELTDEAGRRIEDLVDFKEMITTQLVADPALLNRLFLEAGAAEFRFLIRSGLYFGFLFGLIQLVVWIFYPAWWVLPAFGALVGWVTNWLALDLIFRPLRPRRLGPWTVQGLFLRRQKEVAAVWCRLVTREIVTLRRIVYAMLGGSRSHLSHELIRRHIQPVVDEAMGLLKPAATLAVGPEAIEEIRRSVGDKALAVSTDAFDHWPFDAERAAVVEELLRQRMEALPPEEFQDLLRPCFQEDELKLIIMGGVLGLLAGVAQLVFVFGGAG